MHEDSASLRTAWSPLAAALMAYHRGAVNATVLVSSDLWEDEEMPVREYYRPEKAPLPPLEEAALSWCRGRVLDLGAGAGRHARELELRGHEVVALDVCPEAVEIMRQRGVRGAEHGDLWTLHPSRRFDTVLMLMHGIGVVGDLAGLGRLLERLDTLVAPGGQLLCDSADVRHLLGDTDQEDAEYPGEVAFQLHYGSMHGSEYPWLFVDDETLAILAGAAGWDTEVLVRAGSESYLARLTRTRAT